jgi:hypothetical protein
VILRIQQIAVIVKSGTSCSSAIVLCCVPYVQQIAVTLQKSEKYQPQLFCSLPQLQVGALAIVPVYTITLPLFTLLVRSLQSTVHFSAVQRFAEVCT